MRLIDKLRKYLNSEISSGNLQPGSRLPSYWELSRQFDGSYATILNAIHRLAEEGLVRIEHGNGTYIAGGNHLQITLLTPREYFSFESFGNLLKKHLAGKKLNIRIEMMPKAAGVLRDWSDRIVIRYGGIGELLTYRSDPGIIRELSNELHEDYRQTEDIGSDIFPCQYVSYQIGLNGRMLRQLGVSRKYFTPDFCWWEDFVSRCKRSKLVPVSMNRPLTGKSHLSQFYGFLLAQTGGDPAVFQNEQPLFNTEVGRKMLKILDSIHLYELSPSFPIKGSFYSNDAVMNLMVGSWIYVQNEDPNRTNVMIDDLQTAPYGTGQNRLFPMEYLGVNVSLPENIGPSDRKRVKELMTLMLSRDFQRAWCSLSGMISMRRDLMPEDYSWNRNQMTQAFFLRETDREQNLANLCPPTVCSNLSALLDFYLDRGAEADYILKLMDIRKNLVRKEGSYLSTSYCIEL